MPLMFSGLVIGQGGSRLALTGLRAGLGSKRLACLSHLAAMVYDHRHTSSLGVEACVQEGLLAKGSLLDSMVSNPLSACTSDERDLRQLCHNGIAFGERKSVA